jgi:hypothetical protein
MRSALAVLALTALFGAAVANVKIPIAKRAFKGEDVVSGRLAVSATSTWRAPSYFAPPSPASRSQRTLPRVFRRTLVPPTP